MAKLIKYILTESELQRLTGGQWPERLVKDYIASAVNEETINGEVGDVTAEVVALKVRVTTAEGEIDTLQIDLAALTITTDNHIAAQSAHGATGDIVGTDDYCTASVGGTVLLAAAQANAAASTVAVTSPDAGAAPAAYTQAQMAQVVALVNELKADLTQTVSDLNAAITVINNMLATERTAKQRAL